MPYNYYDGLWQTKLYRCNDCGWSGTFEQAQKGFYEFGVDVLCPRCDHTGLGPSLAVVMNPTLDDLRANSDKPEAKKQLEEIERVRRKLNQS